jgi:Tol biopolymer transport system component
LGPYELIAGLGAGGMGQVYRARDTRLDRLVAVKVLPAHLVDPDARARFEREAKAVAALSHPNILAIHDFGTAGDAPYVVTELLEGETLRARLEAGSEPPVDGRPRGLPLRKAIDIAVQIAQGLAAAHDKNIVHRDLKPENIFIGTDGHVKILDFGLARSAPAAAASTAASPTELNTELGTVMGTVGYMAPEQVKGVPADPRADIFSFGCVLYEMLTGRRAFDRATPAETMTAILRDDPGVPTAEDSGLPPALEQLVRHCLEKQPQERFQSAHDLTFALRALAGSSSGPAGAALVQPVRRKAGAWRWLAFTAAVAIATGASAWWAARRTAPRPSGPIMRTVLPLGEIGISRVVGKDDETIAASPDGRLIAYVNRAHSEVRLHDLQTGESRTLVKEGEVGAPVFSPDGKYVAYIAGVGGSFRTAVWGSLRKISISGGGSTTLADGIAGLKGADWGDDGWIYYCPSPAFGLWRVRADGGAPEKLTDPDAAKGEKTHRWPAVLPGSRAVLFVVGTSSITSFDDARIEALRLSDRSRHTLISGGTSPRFLPTGHLLYERAGQLLAIPFDPDRLTVNGAPVTVADGIADFPAAGTSYHVVSSNGTLFYAPRQAAPPASSIVAVNARGQESKLADATFVPSAGSVSPDGRLLAVDPDGATQQIAIVDLARNRMQRITFAWDNASPLFTADGARLIFRSNAGGGVRRLHWQAADGSGVAEALSTSATADEIPTSIHDGRLLFEDLDPVTRTDIWLLSLADRKREPFLKTPFDEAGARFSPDGRWIAYQSNQSGAWEIYLQPFAASGHRVQVSQGGGVRVMWQPDGRGLTYLRGRDVMRVSFSGSPAGEVGQPVRLFSLEADDLLLDVMHDGRLVVFRPAPTPPSASLNVITNWLEAVRRSMEQ